MHERDHFQREKNIWTIFRRNLWFYNKKKRPSGFRQTMFPAKEVIIVTLLAFGSALAGDINRQSIIFYPETPDLFYCPQEKPISLGGMLVKARPLKKLCEFEGRPLPQVWRHRPTDRSWVIGHFCTGDGHRDSWKDWYEIIEICWFIDKIARLEI